MKLYFMDPASRASININRLKNYSYNMRDKITLTADSIEKLVVLGDGTPEDEVIGIIAWHHTSDTTIGVIKPNRHFTDAYRELKGYLKIKTVSIFLFITDQDNTNLNDLFETIKTIIEEQGITVVSIISNPNTDRLRVFECSLAETDFRVISLISGVENFETPCHEIEDHLLVMAGFGQANDSKEAWRNLSFDQKNKIFSRLKDRPIAVQAFPQHFIAFSIL